MVQGLETLSTKKALISPSLAIIREITLKL